MVGKPGVPRNVDSVRVIAYRMSTIIAHRTTSNGESFCTSAPMTLDNVTFRAGVKVTWVNDLPMDQLIPLNTSQLIATERLNCANVTVKNVQLSGRINNHVLDDIYTDTFMVR